jgi:hypothetical protein
MLPQRMPRLSSMLVLAAALTVGAAWADDARHGKQE